jgi:hypothetical protein
MALRRFRIAEADPSGAASARIQIEILATVRACERLRRYETTCRPRGACRREPLTNDPGRWTWCPGFGSRCDRVVRTQSPQSPQSQLGSDPEPGGLEILLKLYGLIRV